MLYEYTYINIYINTKNVMYYTPVKQLKDRVIKMNKKWIIDEQERDDIRSVVVMAKRLKPGLSEIRALDRGRLIHIEYTRYRTESLYEVCYYYDGDLITKLIGHEIDIFEGVDKTGVETIDIILTSNIDGGTVERSISFTMSGMGKGGSKE